MGLVKGGSLQVIGLTKVFLSELQWGMRDVVTDTKLVTMSLRW